MFNINAIKRDVKKHTLMSVATILTIKDIVDVVRSADSEFDIVEETRILQDAHTLTIFKIRIGAYNSKSLDDMRNDMEFYKIAMH